MATPNNKGGRPLKFKDPKDIQEVADEYFKECIATEEIPTMSGLAYALDVDTETLRNYGKKDLFFGTIKRIRQRVEMAWEQKLLKGSTGCIFWLKNNAGWTDGKQEERQDSPTRLKIEVVGSNVNSDTNCD